MLLEYIARYYKFLWLGLAAIAFLKVILSYYFQNGLEGFNGVVYALFKWYNEDEQEMEDEPKRRTMMRMHNIITLGIYVVILLIVVATLITMFLGR
jgi:hypothetical protein